MIKWLMDVATTDAGTTGAGAGDSMYGGYGYLLGFIYDKLDSKSKYMVDDFARTNPVTGSIFTAIDNMHKAEDYLKNTGLDWSDIKYHNLVIGVGSAVMSSFNFVSKNIDKLYGKR